MTGSIRHRGNRWTVILEIGRDEAGKRIQKWDRSFATKKAAKERLTEVLGESQKGTYVPPSKESLTTYMRSWLDGREASLRPSTLHGYRKNFRAHIEPRIGAYKVQQLTPDIIGRFYAELQAERRLAPRTVRHVHTLLHRALGDLVRRQQLSRNPAEFVELPKVTQEEMRVWAPTDVRAFLEHVRDDRFYALWVTALATGARRGELCGLSWRSLDLDTGTASITDTLLDVGHQVVLGKLKTARGRRVVALAAETVAALRAHLTAQKVERLAFGADYNPDGYVFVREDGAPLHPAWVTRAFTQRVKAAGVPMIRLHDLRHTSASLGLAAGEPITVVSERLGHAKTSITLNVYSHTLPGQHREAADKLAAVMFGN